MFKTTLKQIKTNIPFYAIDKYLSNETSSISFEYNIITYQKRIIKNKWKTIKEIAMFNGYNVKMINSMWLRRK